MKNPGTCRHRLICVSLVLAVALSVATGQADASYRYDVHYEPLQWQQIELPADDFSFLSPGLIAVESFSTPAVPVVEFVTLESPAELNGFEFSTVFFAGARFTGLGYDLENMIGVAFSSGMVWDAPEGVLAGVVVDVRFPAGAYGPGTFEGDLFQRAFNLHEGMTYLSTEGVLTITYVPDAVIPAPGAVLLGTLGAGLVGWLRRRRCL